MYSHGNSRRKKVISIFVVTACTLAFIAYYIFQRSDPTPPPVPSRVPLKQETKQSEIVSIGSPVRIIIPKINVNAVLEYVGLTPEGEMDEPTEDENAAWFSRHPLPGEIGTSVIAGHFGLKDNKPAVFDNLDNLQKGDEIYVKDSKGAVTAFVVREIRNYMPEQDATEVFNSSDGKSHLNLITCKGAWDESRKSYDTRLIVFADKAAP